MYNKNLFQEILLSVFFLHLFDHLGGQLFGYYWVRRGNEYDAAAAGGYRTTDPAEPVDPVTNGEVKQPEEPVEPTDPVEPPIEPEPEPDPIQTVVGTIHPGDFTGQVFLLTTQDRAEAETLPGALVTVVSGPQSGERFLTDDEGRYIFRDVNGDKLHLLCEKDGLEPKEVIVCRDEPTTLANGTSFEVEGDPQNSPGNILMGYRWDDRVRFILEETAVVNDLLLLLVDDLPYGGTYSHHGIITTTHDNDCIPFTLAHEIAHAHQHAASLSELDISNVGVWEDTAEGKSYLKAREKDWEEVGQDELRWRVIF